MKPVDQTIFGFKKGDCMRACVASIFEMTIDEVPNFMENGPKAYADNLAAWCQAAGLKFLDILIEHKELMEYILSDHIIATGASPRNPEYNHAVICKDGKVVHDPHPDKTGIIGPPQYYTVFLIKDPAKYKEMISHD